MTYMRLRAAGRLEATALIPAASAAALQNLHFFLDMRDGSVNGQEEKEHEVTCHRYTGEELTAKGKKKPTDEHLE